MKQSALRGMRLTLEKWASEGLPEEQMPPHPLVTAAKYLGAYGAGVGAGHLGMLGADALSRRFAQRPIAGPTLAKAMPHLAGAGSMLLLSAIRNSTEKIHSDVEKRKVLRDRQAT